MFFKIKSLAGLVRKNNKGRKKYKKLVSFLMIVCFIICTAVDDYFIKKKYGRYCRKAIGKAVGSYG